MVVSFALAPCLPNADKKKWIKYRGEKDTVVVAVAPLLTHAVLHGLSDISVLVRSC